MRRTRLFSAVVALGLVGGPASTHAVDERSLSAGRLALSIDGEPAGFVKRAGGGAITGEVVSHQLGSSHFQKKHLATISHAPLTLELDLSMGEPIWDWLKASLAHGHVARDLALTPDALSATQLFQAFHDTVITAVTFPAMDGSKSEPCYLTVTAASRQIQYGLGGSDAKGPEIPRGKPWRCSDFRMELDGLPTEYVSRIDAITFVHDVAADGPGGRRSRVGPTVARLSNIELTVSALDLDAWFEWYHEFVIEGRASDYDERTGSIELLDASLRATIARLDLYNVGIIAVRPSPQPAEAGEAETFEVELYVEEIAFEHFGGR